MEIERLILGAYQTNCYILRENEAAADCLLIDAGLEQEELIDFLGAHKLNPVAIVLTHGHIDHISGLGVLRENYPGIKVYIHKLDAEMLTGAVSNLSAMTGEHFSTEPADSLIEEPGQIEAAGIKLEVLHVPGHTRGGICLYSKDEGIVFAGDTLFADSIGRTDFPGGSFEQLIDGIKEKLFALPAGTVVYPGHGPATMVGREKGSNPFLQ